MLHRDREHVGYTAISPYIPDSEESTSGGTGELSLDLIAAMLIENAPVLENDFVDLMKSYTGRDPRTIKLMIIDLLDQSDDFVRVGRGTPESPYVLRLNTKVEETPWEADHDGEQLAINQLSLVETGASA